MVYPILGRGVATTVLPVSRGTAFLSVCLVSPRGVGRRAHPENRKAMRTIHKQIWDFRLSTILLSIYQDTAQLFFCYYKSSTVTYSRIFFQCTTDRGCNWRDRDKYGTVEELSHRQSFRSEPSNMPMRPVIMQSGQLLSPPPQSSDGWRDS